MEPRTAIVTFAILAIALEWGRNFLTWLGNVSGAPHRQEMIRRMVYWGTTYGIFSLVFTCIVIAITLVARRVGGTLQTVAAVGLLLWCIYSGFTAATDLLGSVVLGAIGSGQARRSRLHCPQCGAGVAFGAQTCNSCGTRLVE